MGEAAGPGSPSEKVLSVRNTNRCPQKVTGMEALPADAVTGERNTIPIPKVLVATTYNFMHDMPRAIS